MILVGSLLVAAIITGSLTRHLTTTWHDRLGFAPHDLFTLHWSRMFTSAFLTSGGIGFFLPLGTTIILVMTAEKVAGTSRAILAFWLSHLGATVGGSLLAWLAIHWIVSPMLKPIFTERDVGPSAGYFGCLGLIIAYIPHRWKYWIGSAIVAGLIGGIIVSAYQGVIIDISAGIAHIIAFPLGWGTAEVSRFRRLRT